MNFLLAIYLFTGKETPQNDRLAVMSNTPTAMSEVYTLKYSSAFPNPPKDSDLYKTDVDVQEPGTYVTVYCSRKWNSDEIRMRLWNSRDKLSNHERGVPVSRSEAEASCFSLVHSLSRYESPTGEIHSKTLIETGKCTEKNLVDLTLQCEFNSIGTYITKSQSFPSHRPTISFDDPIEMSSLARDGKFINMAKIGSFLHALVWSNGNIHLFLNSSDKKVWSPKSSIIYKPQNGQMITGFLLRTNPQIRKAWDKSTRGSAFDSNAGSSNLCKVKGRVPILGIKLRGSRLAVDRLPSSDATGFLSGKICEYPENFHE
ncbi:putative Bgh-specific protein [Blumeria hordei DH14]|uniref:Putative Bgh-specific protein n=1 Tax=Blumeria graminis f. sp. hordei (strain DH14) TaxID=546991 RepID=N1JAD0_BLUG1|nr:putative Bgh-specific protein [Blumeria hordei DH14]